MTFEDINQLSLM